MEPFSREEKNSQITVQIPRLERFPNATCKLAGQQGVGIVQRLRTAVVLRRAFCQ